MENLGIVLKVLEFRMFDADLYPISPWGARETKQLYITYELLNRLDTSKSGSPESCRTQLNRENCSFDRPQKNMIIINLMRTKIQCGKLKRHSSIKARIWTNGVKKCNLFRICHPQRLNDHQIPERRFAISYISTITKLVYFSIFQSYRQFKYNS